jgi:adenylate cyclase
VQQNFIFKKKALFTIGFLFIFFKGIYSQQSTHVDSLTSIYTSGRYNKPDKLKILREIIEGYTDPDKKLAFSEELIQAARAADSTGELCVGYALKGNALKQKGDLSSALENYFKAAKIARKGEQSGEIYILRYLFHHRRS